MGLIRAAQVKRSKKIGSSVANTLFDDFTMRPEWRGSKFDWASLPDMARRLASETCGVGFPHHVNENIEKVAGDEAHRVATLMIKA